MKTINCTPTWEGLLPWMLEITKNGTKEGKKTIELEFRKMAKAADMYNEFTKLQNRGTAYNLNTNENGNN